MVTSLYQSTSEPSLCDVFHHGIPTFEELRNNHPPEYIPMMVIGAVTVLISIIILGVVVRKHILFTRGPAALNAIRTLLIVAAFTLFAVTSFAAMISPRSTQFLHLVANSFEACCLQFFYENIVNHLRVNGFFDGTAKINLQVPPCCCFLRCLPKMPANVSSVRKLRTGILATIVIHFMLEAFALMRAMECKFSPLGSYAIVIDVLSLIVFMFAMWGLVVFYRSGRPILAQYCYTAKFVAFKLMIFIHKTIYKVLMLLASKSVIRGFTVMVNGEEITVLSNKSRVNFWTNFVTIIASTLLLLLSFGKYKKSDYWPWIGDGKNNGEIALTSPKYHALLQTDQPTETEQPHEKQDDSNEEEGGEKVNQQLSIGTSDDSVSLEAIVEQQPVPVDEEENIQIMNESGCSSPELLARFIPLETSRTTKTEEIVIYLD